MASTFKYILIPANDSQPIQELEGDTSGGLSDDFLSKTAKEYFYTQNGGDRRAAALDNASPEERKLLADKVRSQYGGGSDQASEQLKAMDDDALIGMFRASEASATCEIIALTVPTALNKHRAVSIYADDNARNRNLPHNKRASALMSACGHSKSSSSSSGDGGVAGDVFIGRCHDNEAQDIWVRVDFTKEDVDGDLDTMDWCKVARTKGGGGGFGGSGGAASLSGMMSNALGGGANTGGGMASNDATNSGEQTTDDGYVWSQTEDEVELKFSVAPGTKARDVKVKFQSKALQVSVSGENICNGETFGNLILDDCTYTIQDVAGKDNRELCVILGKKTPENWSWAINSAK